MSDAFRRLIDLDRVDDYSVAVDATADLQWNPVLSIHFSRVLSFSADANRREELRSSCAHLGNVEIRDRDLAESPLDRFELAFCGLIRLDSAETLRGAKRTIQRCWPVLVIEASSAKAVAGTAISMGYRELFRTDADRVYILD